MSTRKVHAQLGSVCSKSSRDLSSVACRGLEVTSWPTPPHDEGLPWNSPVTSVTASRNSHQRQNKRNNYDNSVSICQLCQLYRHPRIKVIIIIIITRIFVYLTITFHIYSHDSTRHRDVIKKKRTALV